jgi:hypothetical protein
MRQARRSDQAAPGQVGRVGNRGAEGRAGADSAGSGLAQDALHN